jgi:dihydroxyacetone kinase phosphoprotein-dependent L subunit
MAASSLDDLDLVVMTMAKTIVDNADYFAQLDSIAGDGDFGYSLRSGWEVVLADYDSWDKPNAGAVCKKIGLTLAAKVGGVSGPMWGTAFLRAGATAGEQELTPDLVIAMFRAAIAGIMMRGGASLGDKTLLDALSPATDSLEESFKDPATFEDHGTAAIQRAADVAVQAALDTNGMLALRGRAAYTGDRSRDSVDAGATAIGVILQAIAAAWRDKNAQQ